MAIDSHTTLEVKSLDRIDLKVIQMRLQNMGGIAWFFRKHRGEAFATNRRLRLRGLITRIPGTQRYEVTDSGQRMALFWLGSMSKTIRPLATSLADETVPYAWYPRLLHAPPEHRANWKICGGGFGIHWPDLDDDLNTE